MRLYQIAILVFALMTVAVPAMAAGPIYSNNISTLVGPIYNSSPVTAPTPSHIGSPATFILYNSTTRLMNSSVGGVLSIKSPAGYNMTLTISPGTYANVSGSIYPSYNVTLSTFKTYNLTVPANRSGYSAKSAFLLEVNHQIIQTTAFANKSGVPKSISFMVNHGANWTSWSYVNELANGTGFTGGSFSKPNNWIYNVTAGTMTDITLEKAQMHVYLLAPNQTGKAAAPVFILYNSTTRLMNSSVGGVLSIKSPAGYNMTLTISPGTYANVSGSIYPSYNVTLSTFRTYNLAAPLNRSGYVPKSAFLFQINHQIIQTTAFVNANGVPKAISFMVNHGANWTSWSYINLQKNGTGYVGGSYYRPNTWTYNLTTGIMTEVSFEKAQMHVYLVSPVPLVNTTSSKPTTPVTPTTTTPATTTPAVTTPAVTTPTSSPSNNTALWVIGIIVVIIIIAVVAWMMTKK